MCVWVWGRAVGDWGGCPCCGCWTGCSTRSQQEVKHHICPAGWPDTHTGMFACLCCWVDRSHRTPVNSRHVWDQQHADCFFFCFLIHFLVKVIYLSTLHWTWDETSETKVKVYFVLCLSYQAVFNVETIQGCLDFIFYIKILTARFWLWANAWNYKLLCHFWIQTYVLESKLNVWDI